MDDSHALLPYLRETLIFLALAGVLIPLLQRYRVNQILGFLALGVLLGPNGLLLWLDQVTWLTHFTFLRIEGMVALGELGVLFLMFTIGLELSAERLWILRRWVFGAGVAQVLFSAIAIGILASLFGNSIESSVVLGLVLALSSTAAVMQLMTERHLLDTPIGQSSVSVLMLQDLAVVPILLLTGLLAQGNASHWLPLLSMVLLKSAIVILLIFFLGRRVIGPLFKALARKHQPATFVALILLSSLGIGGLTQSAGLSMALGAFLAGLLLAETEFRHEVEVTIEPFKSLLLGLFFMSVGMQTDLRGLWADPLGLLLSVVGLFFVKTLVLTIVLRAGHHSWGRALQGGMMLGQGGEFAFIVTGYATATQLFSPALEQFVLLVVGLSMFATPMVARAGELLADSWERHHLPAQARLTDARPDTLQGHVIIVGFGRMGQMMAQLLASQGISYVAIDIDTQRSTQRHWLGGPVYYGDVSRPELLHRLHASQAAAIVLTLDHADAALHATLAIRREFSQLPLLARAHDEDHARALLEAGANLVMPESMEAGLQLSACVLETVGLSHAKAMEVIRNERELRLARMQPR
jgi:CPA2 family monovalent cation:H+ antiporter-2